MKNKFCLKASDYVEIEFLTRQNKHTAALLKAAEIMKEKHLIEDLKLILEHQKNSRLGISDLMYKTRNQIQQEIFSKAKERCINYSAFVEVF